MKIIEFKADDKFPWGKYIGKTVKEVYRIDRGYIDWINSKRGYFIDTSALSESASRDLWKKELKMNKNSNPASGYSEKDWYQNVFKPLFSEHSRITDTRAKEVDGSEQDSNQSIEVGAASLLDQPFSEHHTKAGSSPGATAVVERKVELWKQKLLDLSRRNRMINYRETIRSTLRILDPDYQQLFRMLVVEEKELEFKRPIERGTDPRTYAVIALLEALSFSISVQVGDVGIAGSSLDVRAATGCPKATGFACHRLAGYHCQRQQI